MKSIPFCCLAGIALVLVFFWVRGRDAQTQISHHDHSLVERLANLEEKLNNLEEKLNYLEEKHTALEKTVVIYSGRLFVTEKVLKIK